MANNKLAIIGGSGLYDVEEFKDRELLDIKTPWGKPSDKILKTNFKGKEVYFLPRHGRGHFINPSNINFRSNIDALKQLGVTDIISISAVVPFLYLLINKNKISDFYFVQYLMNLIKIYNPIIGAGFILDEATSALDNITEEKIFNSIFSLGNDLTLIMIAHRLTPLRFCDRIFIIQKNNLEEISYQDITKFKYKII